MIRHPIDSLRRGRLLRAAAVAGTLSGGASTVHALMTQRSPLQAVRAAGALLGRPTVLRGTLAHTTITLGWTAVLATCLPPRRTVWWGALAGLAIGGLDLGIAARRVPAIAALPQVPQLADHVAFGAVAGWMLRSRAVRDG